MAWVRVQGDIEELIVASDSRLRGGYAWDAAPKIIALPRNDAVVAFAGATEVAYPLMIQAANTVASWGKTLNRGQPLEDLKGHLIRVFNRMVSQMGDRNEFQGPFTPDALFLLAGFSWHSQLFKIWTIHWDAHLRRFTFRPATRWREKNDRKKMAIVGDDVPKARELLVELLRSRGRLSSGGFDWEPLEVLVQMIHDTTSPTIGGSPQVMKVYRSLKVVTFSVPWYQQDGSPVLTVLGRPLLSYEVPDRFPLLPFDLSALEQPTTEKVRQKSARRRKTTTNDK